MTRLSAFLNSRTRSKFAGLPGYLVLLGYFLDNQDKYDQQLLEYNRLVYVWENSTSDEPEPSPGIVVDAASTYNKLRGNSLHTYISLTEKYGIATIVEGLNHPEALKAEHPEAAIFLNDLVVLLRKTQPSTAIKMLAADLEKFEVCWQKAKSEGNKFTQLRKLKELIQQLDYFLSDVDPKQYHPLLLKYKEQQRPEYQEYRDAISRDIEELNNPPASVGKPGQIEKFDKLFENPKSLEICLSALQKINPSLTDSNGKWIDNKRGKKSMLVAWWDAVVQNGHNTHTPQTDIELAKMLVAYFPGLTLDTNDAGIFRQNTSTRNRYYPDFLALMPKQKLTELRG